jgi:hypothetical protein
MWYVVSGTEFDEMIADHRYRTRYGSDALRTRACARRHRVPEPTLLLLLALIETCTAITCTYINKCNF